MHEKPTFSVIIPTYHRNDLLAKSLDCLSPGIQSIGQEYYEVIVTDDGVKTTAETMIRDLYPWVKWVEGPRRGPAANRNNGENHARGEWLVFTDDDCLPDPQWLAAFSTSLISDTHVYEGKTTCDAGVRSPLQHAPINLTGGWLWSCNMMISSDLFQKLGRFDESFPYPHLEDVDLRDRIRDKGYSSQFVVNAVVDHPPKKVPSGARLGAFHESDIYYWHEKRGKKISQKELIYQIIYGRLKKITQFPIGFDSLKALSSLLAELKYCILNINTWYKKHPF